MRGYLWSDIAREIVDQFDELTGRNRGWTVAQYQQYAAALYKHEKAEAKRERDIARAHLEPVRNARHGNWWRRLVIANRVAAQRTDGRCRKSSPRQVAKYQREYKAAKKASAGTSAG